MEKNLTECVGNRILSAVTMLNRTRDLRNWKKCVRHTKGGNSTARHKAHEKLAKVKTTLFLFLLLKVQERVFPISSVCNYRVSIHFSRVYHLRS